VYGDFQPHHLDYVVEQLDELAVVAEQLSGRPTSEAELRTVMDEAMQASNLWDQCLATGCNHPAPWTAFDQFIHMAPIVALRGSEKCTEYYRSLRDELEHRAHNGVGAVKNERHRLLWDNIAIWYKLRELSRVFAQNGFALVCATYTDAWADSWRGFEPDKGIESAARMTSGILLNRDLNNRMGIMEEMVQKYDVDGVVLHSDRSCKPYSVGQYDLKDRIAAELGIRVMVIEADHAEPEAFSAEQVDNRINAFMESF
jgi:benzoyl-CoA reductase/2-hydroxyglutaryl-CoA dehydratase subunit BcrC/BadD/HgdB